MTVAYIYIPKQKKYEVLNTDLLRNFNYQQYESTDHEQRTSQIYKGKTVKGNKLKCQVLCVADSVEQLEDKIKRKRIKVPKLNLSTLESSASSLDSTSFCAEMTSNIIAQKRKRKVHNEIEKNARLQVEEMIIRNFLPNTLSPNTAFEEMKSTEEKTIINTHMQRLQDRLHIMEKEMTDLKEQYKKEKQKADFYYNKYNNVKQSGNCPLTENAGQNKMTSMQTYTDTEENKIDETTEEHEAETISLGNDIKIKKFTFNMACNSNDPSKFVITLCYSIWGYEALANRCVKMIKQNDERQIITPKKFKY